MAVAVKNSPAVGVSSPFDRLPVVSLVGAAYVAVCLGVVFTALPYVWRNVLGLTEFGGNLLLGLVMIVALIGLTMLGVRLFGAHRPAARAGVFVGFVGILIVLLLARWAGLWLEYWIYVNHWLGDSESIGLAATAGVAVALLAGEAYLFFQPRIEAFLVGCERQGWFHASSYKGQQGQRVRRGTILAILLIGGSGVLTMINNGFMRRLPDSLYVNVPFTGTAPIIDPGDTTAPGVEMLQKLPAQEKSQVQIVARGASHFRDGQVVSAQDFRNALKADVQAAAAASKELEKKIGEEQDPDKKRDLESQWVQTRLDPGAADWLVGKISDEKVDVTALLDLPSQSLAEAAALGPISLDATPPPNLPTAMLRLDPIVLRKLNDDLRSKYVLVAAPKDADKTHWVDLSGLPLGSVVSRQTFNEAVQGLPDNNKSVAERPFAAASPGPANARLIVLPALQVTLPLLLIALTLWVAWRIVNYPAFADFLIATEAELNKVSWITRKRLIQDTIVVLVTTLLLAVFLFLMDQTWRVLLSMKPIGVLQIDNQRNDLSAEDKKW